MFGHHRRWTKDQLYEDIPPYRSSSSVTAVLPADVIADFAGDLRAVFVECITRRLLAAMTIGS